MNDFVRAARDASLEISSLLERGIDERLLEELGRGHGGDISRGLDMAAEKILVDRLGSYGAIDSEESGIVTKGRESIVIDPVDGSANALSAFPYYGLSVARMDRDKRVYDAVVCNLANGDFFYMCDEGPVCHENLFRGVVNTVQGSLESSIGLFEKAYANHEIVAALDREGLKFRSPGAVALSLAYAHRVRYFLYVGEYRIYDFAAGLALCGEMRTIMGEGYVIVSSDAALAEKIEALVAGD